MISVMLVDDEYIVREDLRTLIDWGAQGFRIVAEAENGKRGLEMYLKYRPQLILTDIKMPVMDGLTMADQIRRLSSQTQFILLTAYGEFDYARKAMEQGICSYLLKHEIDEDSLIRELERVKTVLQQKMLPTLHEGRSLLIVLTLQTKRQQVEAYEGLEGNIRKRLHIEGDVQLFWTSAAECVLFLEFQENRGTEEEKKIGEICRKGIIEDVGTDCLVCVSEPYSRKTSISEWYWQTKRLQDYRYLEEGKKVFGSWDVRKDQEDERIKQTEYELRKAFRGTLEAGEEKAVGEAVDAMLWAAKEEKNMGMLRDAIEFLGTTLWNERVPFDERTERNQKEIEREVYTLDSVKEIADYFRDAFGTLLAKDKPAYSPRIEKAIAYIHTHYSSEITLKKIAEVMEISENYASWQFKNEVGMSFMKYLTEYRMKVAKKLIKEGYKVYEISEMTGYQTVQYFTAMFKKAQAVRRKNIITARKKEGRNHEKERQHTGALFYHRFYGHGFDDPD